MASHKKKPAIKRPPLNPPTAKAKIARELAAPLIATVAKAHGKQQRVAAINARDAGLAVIGQLIARADTTPPPRTRPLPEKKPDWSFKTPKEGRAKLAISGRAKTIPLKRELWTRDTLLDLFRTYRINAGKKQWGGWFIATDKPAGLLTSEQQVFIFLSPSDREWMVKVNNNKQHLVIEDMAGYE